MADSEAKARQKFEEAEKKARKSGGFFGSLLGSGNNVMEACELYNQASDSTAEVIRCPMTGCFRVLSNVADLEDHYRQSHDFQCGECRAKFATCRALHVHIEETHSPLFSTKLNLYPERPHFECFAESTCQERFLTKQARNDHCHTIHHLSNYGLLNEDGHKTAARLADGICAVQLNDTNEFCFGRDQERTAGIFGRQASNGTLPEKPFFVQLNCTQKAVECMEKCIELYIDMGRFNMAAKVHVAIADIYDTEAPNKEKCLKHHQIAADFFKGDEAKSSATKCLIRVAQLSAELGNYRRAIEVFEEIAIYEADHPTLKYAAKNHFFMALLCHLCIDLLDTQNALKRYEDISPSFADSREYKFIKDITICMEEQNAEHFTEAVRNFDKISRLDPWQTNLLLVAKKNCGDGEEEEEDLR
ncbi:Alpha-soluble NSF attachment protein [Aphelenchoides besseyi]|nr:Alpha-soluble NSF attachment protein [Aphelenchoides besseyi]